MNFQQAGYAQALWDLGLSKEAGILDSASRAAKSLFVKAPTVAKAAPSPPTPAQLKFIEGLQSRTVAPQATFKTMAERVPAANVPVAARAKNVPGYDPAVSRLNKTPSITPNIAHQNQLAGANPPMATAIRESDQLLKARQQTPIVNSLFQNQSSRPGLQDAMSLFG